MAEICQHREGQVKSFEQKRVYMNSDFIPFAIETWPTQYDNEFEKSNLMIFCAF